ncbi:hypothetical protein AAC387_Pa12g1033 [Persea americana]
MAKPPLVLDHNTRVRVGRHRLPGNTARPDRYEQSFMAIGSLIYGDKKCSLSSSVRQLAEGVEREGGVLSISPTAASQGKDRWDLTSPTLTHRENERGTITYIYTWDQSHGRYAIHNS